MPSANCSSSADQPALARPAPASRFPRPIGDVLVAPLVPPSSCPCARRPRRPSAPHGRVQRVPHCSALPPHASPRCPSLLSADAEGTPVCGVCGHRHRPGTVCQTCGHKWSKKKPLPRRVLRCRRPPRSSAPQGSDCLRGHCQCAVSAPGHMHAEFRRRRRHEDRLRTGAEQAERDATVVLKEMGYC